MVPLWSRVCVPIHWHSEQRTTFKKQYYDRVFTIHNTDFSSSEKTKAVPEWILRYLRVWRQPACRAASRRNRPRHPHGDRSERSASWDTLVPWPGRIIYFPGFPQSQKSFAAVYAENKIKNALRRHNNIIHCCIRADDVVRRLREFRERELCIMGFRRRNTCFLTMPHSGGFQIIKIMPAAVRYSKTLFLKTVFRGNECTIERWTADNYWNRYSWERKIS